MFTRRVLAVVIGLALALPRGAAAEHEQDDPSIDDLVVIISLGTVLVLGTVVTVIGNGVTYPSADEPVSPSAPRWAIADIVFGSLDVAMAIGVLAAFPDKDDLALGLGFGIPMMALGLTGIGVGAATLHRIPEESAGLRVLPVPFIGSAPGGEVYGGLSFVGVGW